jgi:large subunit ribosomal protein L22
MAYSAIHKHARIAPRKARYVADLIRGLPVDQAMTELSFSKRRAAWYFRYVLKSAIANAENEADWPTSRALVVSEARVDRRARSIKRFSPRTAAGPTPSASARATSRLSIRFRRRHRARAPRGSRGLKGTTWDRRPIHSASASA